jgi:hypothetical protein
MANMKGFTYTLRASVRLGTGACIGMGIGIWNGIDVMLLGGVCECVRAGSCNASLDDAGGKTGGQGV